MMKYDILVIPNFLDSKMIGIEKCETTTTMMMINKVNTMTPRQNDLVVKKNFFSLIGMAVGNGHSVLRKKHRSFANLEIGQQ